MGKEKRARLAAEAASAARRFVWVKVVVGFLLIIPVGMTLAAMECWRRNIWPWELGE